MNVQNVLSVKSFARYLPILQWLPNYKKEWLRPDLVAGMTLAAFTIPEAIAYAELADLPPQTGLYASIAAPILYMFLGTSRQLAVGPTSAVSILTASGLGALALSSPQEYAAVAAGAAVLAGAMALTAYALRLGFVVNFISEAVLVGFSAGAALYIASTQLTKLFGITGAHGQFIERISYLAGHIGEANLWAVCLGVAGIITLVAGEHRYPKLPWPLMVVVGSVGLTSIAGLSQFGVRVVGHIPTGLPDFTLPSVPLPDEPQVLRTAIAVFVLSYVEGMSMARTFASKNGYRVDANQELLALGVASLGAGLTQAYPVAGSFSRSALNDAAGAKSQLANGIGGALVALVVLYLAGFFADLPEPILASVVLVAVRGLFRVSALRKLYDLRRVEFWTAMGALAGVLILGILDGVIIGVLLSLLLVIGRASQPRLSLLGRVPGQPQFSDLRENPENTTIPGLHIIRVDEGIFYANAESIQQQITALVRSSDPPTKTVVLDMEMTSDLDLPGAEMLAALREKLRRSGAYLRLSRVQPGAQALLDRAGVTNQIGEEHFHSRTLYAVAAYLTEEGAMQRAGCDILPDLVRCVQDLVGARLERAGDEDRPGLEDINRSLESILHDLDKLSCPVD
ncbi:MAG: sulfate permease [Pseudomonadota bacterium]